MSVPSYAFLGFAAVVFAAVHLSATLWWRRAVLLAANIGFILSFTHNIMQLAPFAALLLGGFLSIKVLERQKLRPFTAALVLLLILAFCWLKRYSFFPASTLLPFVYFAVGMSYIFFRILHLVIDAAQDVLPDRMDLLSYLNYTLNFTCIVSGPIQFYQDYRRCELSPLPLDPGSIERSLHRIVIGFFKVAIVSPLLLALNTHVVGTASGSLETVERLFCSMAIVAVYPVYIYFNFSGYTDFVIGTARLLGIELPENFNRPFVSESFIEFWGRWHMTLSNWLKTYVYSPLLLHLMRRFTSKPIQPLLGVVAFFVTFFLIGAWHGQTSMFLFFGVLLGFGVSVNKIYDIVMADTLGRKRYGSLKNNAVYAALSRGLTYTYVAFSLLWFWSSWAQLESFERMNGAALTGAVLCGVWLTASIILAALKQLTDFADSIQPQVPALLRLCVKTAFYTVLVVTVLSSTIVLNAPAPHIIYKAF
jgi:alginate O-acetyltransferase complex protein AlgI